MAYVDLLNYLNLESGEFLAIIGIVIAVFTFIAVLSLDGRRRKDEERYAKNKINENLKQSLKIFDDIVGITELKETTEQEEIAIANRLDGYFHTQFDEIPKLIKNTERNMGEWKSLKENSKKDIDTVLRCLSWLIEEYFPYNAEKNEQKDSWPPLRTALVENRRIVYVIVTRMTSGRSFFSKFRKQKSLEIHN